MMAMSVRRVQSGQATGFRFRILWFAASTIQPIQNTILLVEAIAGQEDDLLPPHAGCSQAKIASPPPIPPFPSSSAFLHTSPIDS
jgi:hypothetical protein